MSKNKKNKNKKSLIKIICVALATILTIACVYVIYILTTPKPSGLENTFWKSVSAYDASNDEVEIEMVYNNYYSSYQGSMIFNEDMTFDFWMGPGNPEDGSHKGTYTYNADNDTVNAVFDNGKKAVFKIVRSDDDSIKRVEAPYNGYTIWFVPKY